MPIKKYTESLFLSGIVCPAYIEYKNDIYELELSQQIANHSLIYFLENIQSFILGLDIDDLINQSIKNACNKKLTKATTPFKKRIFAFCSNFIYQFLKHFPPSTYYPILTEVKIPIAIRNIEIGINYDIILKNLETDEIIALSIISSLDSQIKTNINYFHAKKNLITDRLSLLYSQKEIKFFLYYIPKIKTVSLNQTLNIYIKELDTKSGDMKDYLELFFNKLKIKKNPFCLNFSCQKRKECTNA